MMNWIFKDWKKPIKDFKEGLEKFVINVKNIDKELQREVQVNTVITKKLKDVIKGRGDQRNIYAKKEFNITKTEYKRNKNKNIKLWNVDQKPVKVRAFSPRFDEPVSTKKSVKSLKTLFKDAPLTNSFNGKKKGLKTLHNEKFNPIQHKVGIKGLNAPLQLDKMRSLQMEAINTAFKGIEIRKNLISSKIKETFDAINAKKLTVQIQDQFSDLLKQAFNRTPKGLNMYPKQQPENWTKQMLYQRAAATTSGSGKVGKITRLKRYFSNDPLMGGSGGGGGGGGGKSSGSGSDGKGGGIMGLLKGTSKGAGKAAKLFKVLGPMIKGGGLALLAGGFMALLRIVTPIDTIMQSLSESFGIYGDLLSEIFAPAMEEVFNVMFSDEALAIVAMLGEAFKPIVAQFVKMLPLLLPLGAAFANLLVGLMPVFDLIAPIIALVVSVLTFVVAIVADLLLYIKPFLQMISRAITFIFDGISWLFTKISKWLNLLGIKIENQEANKQGNERSAAAATAIGFNAYATGGIAWTPQIATVAENEPEMIIPFSKLGNMGGSTTINVYGNANQSTVNQIRRELWINQVNKRVV